MEPGPAYHSSTRRRADLVRLVTPMSGRGTLLHPTAAFTPDRSARVAPNAATQQRLTGANPPGVTPDLVHPRCPLS